MDMARAEKTVQQPRKFSPSLGEEPTMEPCEQDVLFVDGKSDLSQTCRVPTNVLYMINERNHIFIATGAPFALRQRPTHARMQAYVA